MLGAVLGGIIGAELSLGTIRPIVAIKALGALLPAGYLPLTSSDGSVFSALVLGASIHCITTKLGSYALRRTARKKPEPEEGPA